MNADFSALAGTCAKDNIGGLGQSFYPAPHTSVTDIGAASAMEVSTITMDTGKVFTKMISTNVASKRTWNVESVGDADSGGYKVTAEYFVPKVTAARVDAVDGPCSIIAICPDRNGNNRIVGDVTTPATMKYKEEIVDGTNGFTITIEWETGNIPYFFTGSIPV